MKRLCTSFVDPRAVSPLLTCRLIALDKCPRIGPVGIGDMARCIIVKIVLMIARGDIQDAAGSLQLCAGQISRCEAAAHSVRSAVHSVQEVFQNEDTEAVLLVDASNAFDYLNRMSALHNIRHHATYATLTHGLSSKWSYLTRTIPNVRHHFQPLDNILRSVFIPILKGRPPPNDIDMSLFALPARLGGLELTLPYIRADCDFKTSLRVTFPLRDLIHNQHQVHSFTALDGQLSARANIRRERRLQATTEADSS